MSGGDAGALRVYYHTLGCKANQYDTERMRQEGEVRLGATVGHWSEADVCVVNTCTVTNQADANARAVVRRIRRENPEARVVVAGCSAALKADDYRAMDEVSAVVEGHDPVAVARAAGAGAPAPVQIELRTSLDRMDTEPIGGTRLARGASRSRPPEEIVAEARLLARRHPELVVTGIHIGHYGRDLDPRWTLSRLVALLLDEVPEVRLRLGSVEATEVDDLLVELLATSGGRVAPHLHMPLQSGADPVLRGMRRWHTREQYRRRALEIAERVAPLGLGADIITGFPGETEADHGATRALVEELPFTYLHVFPFSPRDGTAALELPDPVPQRVAGERSRELRELVHEKGRRHRAGRVGQGAAVVLEGDGGSALTGDYLRVQVPEAPAGGDEALLAGTLQGDGDHLYIAWPREAPPN